MEKIINYIFIIGVAFSIIYFVHREIIIYTLIILNGLLLLVFYLISDRKRYQNVYWVIIIISIFYLLKILFYQQVDKVFTFTLLVSSIGYGLYLINEKKAYTMFRYIYFSLTVIVLYYYLSGTHPSYLSEYSSGNIVNFIFLVFSITFIGLHYQNTNRITIIPAVLSLLVSFWTLGRMGIVSSFILLIGLIGIILLKYRKKINQYLIWISFILIIIFGYLSKEKLVSIINNIFTKFGRKSATIIDDPRAQIIQDYFSNLDIMKVFFGYNFSEHKFYGFTNLHNGFLNIHYLFGISGLIIILIILYSTFIAIKERQFVFLVLMISLFLRMSTDSLILVGVYDFTLMYLILSVIYHKNDKISLKYK